MKNPQYLLIGLLGGLALELLQLEIYKGRLVQAKYRKLLGSSLFWICTLGLVFGAGLIAWGLNADRNDQRILDVFVTGVAARSIIRELLTAKNIRTPTRLGDAEITPRDIFS